MSTNKTLNYQLNQWEPGDQVLREDFNADNQKIDAALTGLAAETAGKADAAALAALNTTMPRIAVGSYTGTGTYGAGSPNTLTFDFEPKLVIIAANQESGTIGGAILVRGQSLLAHFGYSSNGGGTNLHMTWSEHSVSWYSTANWNEAYMKAQMQFNAGGTVYSYFAVG